MHRVRTSTRPAAMAICGAGAREGAEIGAGAACARRIAVGACDEPGAVEARRALWAVLHAHEVVVEHGELEMLAGCAGKGQRRAGVPM
jgi:hypothetical protein